MTVWQRRARFVVAVFGIVSAVVVYFAIGRRPPPVIPTAVTRIDPNATQESRGGNVERFRENRRPFEIVYETELTYPDGTTRMIKVNIHVTKPDGHSYVVTAGEAESRQDQTHLQLSSGVHLVADDGFDMKADRATYNKTDGTIHSDVPVSFAKGRMTGSGTEIDYDENNDVLTVKQNAHVTTVDERGVPVLDFTAGSAVIDRTRDVMSLDARVHVLRDEQTMDADRATAHLSPNDDFVTFIELRGNSRVAGGNGPLDAMSARDIDLDYTDDGQQLEGVVLNGMAGLTLNGTNGAAGRQLTGGSLDVRLAPGGSVTSAVGRENVRMAIPAAADAPPRTISGRALDATGAPGQGLTDVHFTDAVEYREEPTGSADGRVAHSSRLDLLMSGDAVSAAAFTGAVTFEEPAFRAQAANARYDPTAGTLHLNGNDSRGQPCLADDDIGVDAQTIDVTVETHRMKAAGTVKAALRPGGATATLSNSSCAVARQRSQAGPKRGNQPVNETHLPGLLKQDQIVNATADALDYGGTGQSLEFRGTAVLLQGERDNQTSLRGTAIRIDQEQGNLVVTGGARATLVQGTADQPDKVDARAEEITYTDARRLIEYWNAPQGATKKGTGTVRMNGPQGNLEARKIEVFLRPDDGRTDRLEAYQDVTARIDTKVATADRLTYLAETDQYDMKGAGTVPARIVDSCGETSGKTVSYYKADNIIRVRGNGELPTQSKSSSCQQAPSPSR